MNNHKKTIIMGIESSCDETGVAIICVENGEKIILSNTVLSQLKDHKAFGGVVPEIAARAHMQHIDTLIKAALEEASLSLENLDAVAATTGPGLIGGVMIGMMAGKSIAVTQNIPFISVNHLEAHVLTPRLTNNVEFPYLVLLVSGGHTQILIANEGGQYQCLGSTLDDALGECFDKSAKLMGLGYPGGPELEKIALECRNKEQALEKYPLPSPLKGRKGCDFSFSGLKTAVRTHVEKMQSEELNRQEIADLAYAFQVSVADILKDRCQNAISAFQNTKKQSKGKFIVCGGVAANQYLRSQLNDLCDQNNMEFIAPPLKLCSDNGAMIAWVGYEKYVRSEFSGLDIAARPRWPLDENYAINSRKN